MSNTSITIPHIYRNRFLRDSSGVSTTNTSSGGGGSVPAGTATESWVDGNYVSIEFFNRLFRAKNGNTTIWPNETSSIDSIEALYGFWTNSYISALGQNSSGGGGTSLNQPLLGINNAGLADHPSSSGQAIIWDGTGWTYGNAGGVSGVTNIGTGTGLSGGPITSTGIISISNEYQTYIDHGQTAYGWGDHSQAGYLTSADLTGYLTKTEANNTYLSIAFFNRLFQARNGANVVQPNDTTSTIDSIKAMFGFWTDQYISALGQNSSGGGGGGASYLNDLNDVTITNPSSGQVLAYNGTDWVNTGGYATETWVTNQNYLTSSALNGYATQQWVTNQNYLTSSALNGYATQQWVINQGYLTSSALTGYATEQWVTNQNYLTSSALDNYYTKTESDGRYITKDFFRSLFRAYDSNGNEIQPNTTIGIDNIKAMFGFWTNSYISALGQNSSGGGGGGASALYELSDVLLTNPANGDLLKYNGQKWVNVGGYATETWVSNQGYLTSSALTGYATQSWVQNQNYLTSSALNGYATQQWVNDALEDYSYIEDNTTYKTIHIDNDNLNIYNWALASSKPSYTFNELTAHPNTLSGYGIGDASITAEIITNKKTITLGQNSIDIYPWATASSKPSYGFSEITGSVAFNQLPTLYWADVAVSNTSNTNTSPQFASVRIGDGLITWDSTNNAFKIQKYDASNAGLYATSFISALGANSSGGGGGASTLDDLLDVELNNETNGDLLKYNGQKWVNASGYATQSWVTNQNYITSSDLSGYATQSWVTNQGYLTSSALTGYATQSWVQNQNYLTSSALTGYATQSWVTNQGYITSVSGTFWGQSFTNGGTVSGNMTGVGLIQMSGNIYMNWGNNAPGLMFEGYYNDGTEERATFGLHAANSGSWYNINGTNIINLMLCANASNTVAKRYVRILDALKIGDGMLTWDSTNNAFKVIKSDGTAANLYATGGVSALGFSSGTSSVDAMSFNYLSVNNTLNINKDNYSNYIYTNNSGTLTIESNNETLIEGGLTVNDDYLNITGDSGIKMNGNYIYLNSNVYLYTDGTDLKINVNGTNYKLLKTTA